MNKNFLLSLGTALLFALGSPLYNQFYLVPFIFIPWLWAIKNSNSYKEVIFQGFIVQIGFAIGIFWWIPQSFSNLWQNSVISNWGLFLFLILFLQLQFPLWAIGRKFLVIKNQPLLIQSLCSAGLYVILDLMVLKFFRDSLGHTWHMFDFWKGSSYFLTIPGLSFLLMLLNEFLFIAIFNKKNKPLFFYIIALIILFTSLNQLRPEVKKDMGLKVAIVQSNFSYEKIQELKKNKPQIFKIILGEELILQIKKAQDLSPDLIVFSESIHLINWDNPISYKEKNLNDEIRNIINYKKIPVLMGTQFNWNNGLTNGMVYFNFDELGVMSEQKFYKNKLFPFGEHVPFKNFIPFELPTVDLTTSGEIIKGEIKGKTFAVLICFETIVPSYTKEVIKKINPDFIISPTNETYFDTFGEPQLALALTSFRAAEHNIPILRVGNTGISSIINSQGKVLKTWPMNKEIISIINF